MRRRPHHAHRETGRTSRSLRQTADQKPFPTGSRAATHSTYEVIGNTWRQCRRNQRCWRQLGPMQLTSNAERSRVSVNGRLPKPVIPRTIGSPPRLPASPLPRKQLNPKGTVDRNAQSERRNASRPVQPRAHPRHLEWDGERRGRRPGVRLVEIERATTSFAAEN